MLNLGGKFKMLMSSKICSNHFTAGYCPDVCRITTLHLKGYATEPTKRAAYPCHHHKKCRQVIHDGSEDICFETQTPNVLEHDHDVHHTEQFAHAVKNRVLSALEITFLYQPVIVNMLILK